MRRLLNLSAGLEWVLLWRIVCCNCMKGMSVESDNWLLMDRIRTVSQNIWPCKAGVCLVSDPSSRLHLCTYVRTNIHSYLFCVWCVVTFSQASVVLRFLVVHITTFTRLFSCVVCRSNFNSIPDFRVPNWLCHCLPQLFYCVVCRDTFISVPDLGFLIVCVTPSLFILLCSV